MCENVYRRDSLNCNVLRESKATLLQMKCDIECAIKKLETADMIENCQVQLASPCSLSQLTELGATNMKLLQEFTSKLLEHARKHPAHTGRREADSGYCTSTELSSQIVKEESQCAIAERQEYPTNTEDLAALSIQPHQTAPAEDGGSSHC